MTKNFLPTLVLGIGGTGVWILSHLKKELLLHNDAQIPEQVKLLCFDSWQKAYSHPNQGGLSVNQDELIIIEAGKRNQESEIDDNKFTHGQKWLSEGMLKDLPDKKFNLSEGAGQIRKLGRFALVYDFDFLKHIHDTVMLIHKKSPQKRLQVLIVSSIYSDTATGMLIDAAVMVRRTANKENIDVRIEGFVIDSGRSAQGNTLAQKLCSFASYRELDRIISRAFDNPHPRFGLVDSPHPFDFCRIVQRDQEHLLPDIENSDVDFISDVARTLFRLVESH